MCPGPLDVGFRKHTNYKQTAPPDENFPRIVSRLHTLENESKICRQAFPPGEYFKVPPLPNVTSVNILGGFFIAKDRLAIVDGESASVYSHSVIPISLRYLVPHSFDSIEVPAPILVRSP